MTNEEIFSELVALREDVAGLRSELSSLRSTVAEIDTPEIRRFISAEIQSNENRNAVSLAVARAKGSPHTRFTPRERPPEYPEGVRTREQKMEHEGFLIDGTAATRELGKKLRAARLEREKAGIE